MLNSGIYEIVNRENGHRYVGSAIDLDARWTCHLSLLSSGHHHSRHLQAAWDRYGPGAFKFKILFLCGPDSLLPLEQMAIDGLLPEYNVCPVAGNTLGRRHTPEARAKMSKNRSPEAIARAVAAASAWHTGRPQTEETKKKISAGLLGKKRPSAKGHPHSAETRAKMSAAAVAVRAGETSEQRSERAHRGWATRRLKMMEVG